MARLPLYHGEEIVAYTLVDDSDWHFLERHRWYVQVSRDHQYAVAFFGRKAVMLHKLVFGWNESDYHIDHINRNTLDNRRENLRAVHISDNLKNRGKTKVSANPYKGISWSKTRLCWQVTISGDVLKVGLGRYGSEIDAALAYDHGARILHGQYAVLNLPGDQAPQWIQDYVEAAIDRARQRQAEAGL